MAINRTRQVQGLSFDVARESPASRCPAKSVLLLFGVGRRAPHPYGNLVEIFGLATIGIGQWHSCV